MEGVRIRLADEDLYDKLCRGPESLRDCGDLMVVTKDSGTEGGRPIVLLTFTVEMPDGTFRRAQTAVTGRLFAGVCAAFRGRYGDEGDMVRTADRVN